jgi:hypothetical protein
MIASTVPSFLPHPTDLNLTIILYTDMRKPVLPPSKWWIILLYTTLAFFLSLKYFPRNVALSNTSTWGWALLIRPCTVIPVGSFSNIPHLKTRPHKFIIAAYCEKKIFELRTNAVSMICHEASCLNMPAISSTDTHCETFHLHTWKSSINLFNADYKKFKGKEDFLSDHGNNLLIQRFMLLLDISGPQEFIWKFLCELHIFS